jgi:hypothetical protein
VVNSSLFGLSGKVENLTQAIALLGTRPLKLLVLGFSLPDGLLDDLDARQLEHYWRGALTRAVAARQLAETMWNMPGDDAFLVALLQDIGVLVLLQQLGTPYARFLTQIRAERGRLVDMERSTLGFDHRELTVALLRQWQLPAMYADAIVETPPRENTTHAPDRRAITQVVDLATRFAELVDERRLLVLPELLERGEQYCAMTKDDLSRLVAEIDPQVEQLAGVLEVQLSGGETYSEVLAAAHRKLAQVAEDAAGMLIRIDDKLCDEVLVEARDLQQAVHDFARMPVATPQADHAGQRADAGLPPAVGPRPQLKRSEASAASARHQLAAGVAAAAAACRQRRTPLSLLLFEAATDNEAGLEIDADTALQSAVQQLVLDNDIAKEQVYRMAPASYGVVLPAVERREGVELAKQLATLLAESSGGQYMPLPLQLKAGVASIAAIPKGFEPPRLLTAADGCLAAARASGGSAIKSIEAY